MNATLNRHHVVVVGAGFGGLETVRALAGRRSASPWSIAAIITCFSRFCIRSTASLAPSEIAWPIRHLLRKRREVTTVLASVEAVDKAALVRLDDGSMLAYDTLVLATGARHAYFGHDDWEPSAPGLKTLEDATTIRGRILIAFERAEQEPDETKRAALMTFVIVGAGPTGVELAGTIAELARATLPADFRNIDTGKARIVLIEAGPRVLPAFRPDLSAYASLERLGVEVELGQAVTEMHGRGRRLRRQDPGRGDGHLGGRGAGLAGCAMARRAGGPGRAPEGRAGPHGPGPSGDLRYRRFGDRRPP